MKNIFASLILFMLCMFVTQAQIVNRTTQAGSVEWTQGLTNSELVEVSLSIPGTTYGDGYDGAFGTTVTGTHITYTTSLTFSSTYAVAVQHVVVTNTEATASKYTLVNGYPNPGTGNLGSDDKTNFHYKSASDNQYYSVSSDQAGATARGKDPVVSFIWGTRSPGGSPKLSNRNDNIGFSFVDVPIASGDTHGYIFLAGVGHIDNNTSNTAAGAYRAVQLLLNTGNWPADFYDGITFAEQTQIVNFEGPKINSFTPTSGAEGTMVTISGSDFTGATDISFGGIAASSFKVVDDNTINAEVATGASGNVSVTTLDGSRSKSGFTFIEPPSALSYANSPISATYATAITTVSPTVSGTVDSYSISPELPTGLSLNTSTGEITGTSSVISSQIDYTVTATNTGGNTIAILTLIVNQKELTISGATSTNKIYDGTTDAIINGATLVGAEPGDAVILTDSVNGVFTQANVGAEIAVSTSMNISGADASNYFLTQTTGLTGDITQKVLTITADNKSKEYDGNLFSPFTVNYTGFVTGEDQNDLSGKLVFGSTATSATDVGATYVITPSGLSSSNYSISFVDGALDINQKALIITADDQSKEYDGNLFSPFTVNFTGFVTGEDQNDLSGTLVFGGTATSATDVGATYVITPSGLSSSNYSISFVDGSLDINQKALIITADDQSKEYDGNVFSSFTVSYIGFILGEDQNNLSGTLVFGGTATSATDVGATYVITPSGLSSSNYSISFVDGSLDITGIQQTISFDPIPQKTFGDSDFMMNATASSGLNVIFSSSNKSVAIVSGNTITIKGIGSSTIYANQPGNSIYMAAPQADQNLIVIQFIAGDTNNDGVITNLEIAGDINGDAIINNGEIAGDINGDRVIGDDEITGDKNGDGIISNGELEGDTNGDGINDANNWAVANADDDGDGIVNSDEDSNDDGNPFNDDCDNDGTPNFKDADSCGEVARVSTIQIAEAFTPNGDGINDSWAIGGIKNYPNNKVSVYNRNGQEVYTANGYQNGWEAQFKSNTKKLPAGSYYYVIDLNNGSNPVSGWVFINY